MTLYKRPLTPTEWIALPLEQRIGMNRKHADALKKRATPFGPHRAVEIRATQKQNGSVDCTPGENAFIEYVWLHMPPMHSWLDALMAISSGLAQRYIG